MFNKLQGGQKNIFQKILKLRDDRNKKSKSLLEIAYPYSPLTPQEYKELNDYYSVAFTWIQKSQMNSFQLFLKRSRKTILLLDIFIGYLFRQHLWFCQGCMNGGTIYLGTLSILSVLVQCKNNEKPNMWHEIFVCHCKENKFHPTQDGKPLKYFKQKVRWSWLHFRYLHLKGKILSGNLAQR